MAKRQNRHPRKHHLRAKKSLEKLRKTSKESRYQFLISLRKSKQLLNNKKASNIINSIMKAERTRQGLRIQKAITKPQSEAGGLSHILLKNNTNIIRIEDKTEMHTILHKRNITHFSQAKNTPCVNGPLATILAHNGVRKPSKDILERKATNKIPDNLMEICRELEQTRLPQSKHMPFKDMINGLRIAIYWTLIKALNNEYHQTNRTESNKEENNQQQKASARELSIHLTVFRDEKKSTTSSSKKYLGTQK
jgi:hypothetical protein